VKAVDEEEGERRRGDQKASGVFHVLSKRIPRQQYLEVFCDLYL
jgi:hypothetical protein